METISPANGASLPIVEGARRVLRPSAVQPCGSIWVQGVAKASDLWANALGVFCTPARHDVPDFHQTCKWFLSASLQHQGSSGQRCAICVSVRSHRAPPLRASGMWMRSLNSGVDSQPGELQAAHFFGPRSVSRLRSYRRRRGSTPRWAGRTSSSRRFDRGLDWVWTGPQWTV